MVVYGCLRSNDVVYDLCDAKTIIGRDPEVSDLALDVRSISRQHVEIEFLPDRTITIKDLNSLNGTFVNDTRVVKGSTMQLQHGDILRFAYDAKTYAFEDASVSSVSRNDNITPHVNVAASQRQRERPVQSNALSQLHGQQHLAPSPTPQQQHNIPQQHQQQQHQQQHEQRRSQRQQAPQHSEQYAQDELIGAAPIDYSADYRRNQNRAMAQGRVVDETQGPSGMPLLSPLARDLNAPVQLSAPSPFFRQQPSTQQPLIQHEQIHPGSVPPPVPALPSAGAGSSQMPVSFASYGANNNNGVDRHLEEVRARSMQAEIAMARLETERRVQQEAELVALRRQLAYEEGKMKGRSQGQKDIVDSSPSGTVGNRYRMSQQQKQHQQSMHEHDEHGEDDMVLLDDSLEPAALKTALRQRMAPHVAMTAQSGKHATDSGNPPIDKRRQVAENVRQMNMLIATGRASPNTIPSPSAQNRSSTGRSAHRKAEQVGYVDSQSENEEVESLLHQETVVQRPPKQSSSQANANKPLNSTVRHSATMSAEQSDDVDAMEDEEPARLQPAAVHSDAVLVSTSPAVVAAMETVSQRLVQVATAVKKLALKRAEFEQNMRDELINVTQPVISTSSEQEDTRAKLSRTTHQLLRHLPVTQVDVELSSSLDDELNQVTVILNSIHGCLEWIRFDDLSALWGSCLKHLNSLIEDNQNLQDAADQAESMASALKKEVEASKHEAVGISNESQRLAARHSALELYASELTRKLDRAVLEIKEQTGTLETLRNREGQVEYDDLVCQIDSLRQQLADKEEELNRFRQSSQTIKGSTGTKGQQQAVTTTNFNQVMEEQTRELSLLRAEVREHRARESECSRRWQSLLAENLAHAEKEENLQNDLNRQQNRYGQLIAEQDRRLGDLNTRVASLIRDRDPTKRAAAEFLVEQMRIRDEEKRVLSQENEELKRQLKQAVSSNHRFTQELQRASSSKPDSTRIEELEDMLLEHQQHGSARRLAIVQATAESLQLQLARQQKITEQFKAELTRVSKRTTSIDEDDAMQYLADVLRERESRLQQLHRELEQIQKRESTHIEEKEKLQERLQEAQRKLTVFKQRRGKLSNILATTGVAGANWLDNGSDTEEESMPSSSDPFSDGSVPSSTQVGHVMATGIETLYGKTQPASGLLKSTPPPLEVPRQGVKSGSGIGVGAGVGVTGILNNKRVNSGLIPSHAVANAAAMNSVGASSKLSSSRRTHVDASRSVNSRVDPIPKDHYLDV